MDVQNTPNPSEKKPDEAKSSPTPINSFSPPPDPIKFASPFSPSDQIKSDSVTTPAGSPPKTEPVKDVAAGLKSNSPADPFGSNKPSSLDSIKTDTPPTEKKSNTGLVIAIAAILAIAASIITGVIVYSWQTTQISPLQKEKALLQSQVGNLQSQLNSSQKDKEQLQTQLESVNSTTSTPSTNPPPAAPSTPEITPNSETPAPPAEIPPAPAPAPTPAPTPGQ